MSDKTVDPAILGLTAQIVAAHSASNEAGAGALPATIRAVYDTLSHIDQAPAAPVEKVLSVLTGTAVNISFGPR